MENFIVSARKYRPSTFDSVVGQISIAKTLKNAISSHHLAKAYLFCGPRGVGKTTCARIFAKTINCFHLNENTEPCDDCESCKSFNQSRSFNIHELDAASNNSVDDIRTLIEQVRIPPQVGKYSIYIIDEVHMLSTSAFNAFLKTLEEPPKHAVFILATTEKHKIIPTILSRCQIFDFNRIQIDDIVQYLEKISKNEGNEFEPDGLNIIAQKADGAMRDALSIYDQINSFSGGKITYKNVIENLNVLDYDYYFRLTDAFIKANIAESFLIFDEILSKGFDAHNFITGFSKHFRDLLICKDQSTLQLLEVGNNIKEKYKLQSGQCPPEFLFECLNICGQCDMNFKSARNQRLHVELALVQLCQALDKKKSSDQAIIEPSQGKSPSVAQFVQPVQTNSTRSVNSKQTNFNTIISSNDVREPGEKNYYSSTPSIKNLLKQNTSPKIEEKGQADNSKTKAELKTIHSENFDDNKLLLVYNRFVDSIKTEKPRLFSALNSHIPKLSGNSTIEIVFSNQAQQEDFVKNLKQDMTEFMRNELNNDNISVEMKISEKEQKNLLYTDEDKYKHMLAKNPILGKLKQQMNLDFE